MYSVLDYGRMAGDRVRMGAYSRAISRVVKPGAVVLDIGAGTGIFSLLAARAGARRVHAVDLNPAVLLLEPIAAENGLSDRITIHHKSSYDLVLDEKVDVVIADLRGSSPLYGDNTGAMRDAHARLLKPGGVLLPARDRLMVAVTESEPFANRLARGWGSFERFGFKASAAQASIHNSVYDDSAESQHASDVLTTAECWATLEYATYDGSALEGVVELAVQRPGVAHGFALWFEATIAGDLGYTTAPGNSLAYSRMFLPLEKHVDLEERDRVKVTLRADARGSRWAWDTEIIDGGGKRKIRLRQASFLGMPTSHDELIRASSTYSPVPSPRGARMLRILESMDGKRTVADLAELAAGDRVAGAAPLPSPERRVEEVREAVERYSR